uniref:ISXO2-like transposase domain-containing protein n=1 Tax=Ditylenchus dipsaci TaxID=166011 RepID=A0A915EFV0_9BILA
MSASTSPISTQTVETTWQKFKLRHKYEYGTHRSVFRSYISDFVWRRKFKGVDIMFHLWLQIVLLYACE